MKMAVIGGGLFGCSTAIQCSKQGWDVDLLEADNLLCNGSTLNNHNRIHMGYHYPRSMETVQQCKDGYSEFENWFEGAISSKHKKFYCIGSDGSYLNADEYECFMKEAGLDYKYEYPDGSILDRTKVEASYRVSEPLYDASALRNILSVMLNQSKVRVLMSNAVRNIEPSGDGYELDGVKYDVVINATYSSLNRFNLQLGLEPKFIQLEDVVIPVVFSMDVNHYGVTIMDGPFPGFMPKGMQDYLLLYHVVASRVKEVKNTVDHCFDIVEAMIPYFPFLKDVNVIGAFETVRALVPSEDDARLTDVEQPLPNYFTIFSGKVTTCVTAADTVVEMIKNG